MRAGQLRHQVVIQGPVTGSPTRTLMGAPDDAWANVCTCWARVSPLRSREQFLAQAADSRVTTEIEIRYRPGITAAMRVKHGSTYYNIEGVRNPDERNQRLLLDCSTGLNDG